MFGTCGVTPRELDTEYPFMDYEFMLGRCDVVSVKDEFIRTRAKSSPPTWKTRDNYRHRVAYCTGDFRKAMLKALTILTSLCRLRRRTRRLRQTSRRVSSSSMAACHGGHTYRTLPTHCAT